MKKQRLKIELLFVLLLSLLNGNTTAQTIGSWKTYMAYYNAEIVVETKTLVFGVYDGSLLSYDPEYDEVTTYGFAEGLSDVGIIKMKYIPDHHALIIVYKNSNIDIFYGKNDVVNLPFLKDDLNIEKKEVYDIEIIDDYVYLSAGYGIIVIDVKNNVHKEDYKLGVKIKSVCKIGDYLYAATEEGFKKGLMSLNLMDKEKWEAVETGELNYPGKYANIQKILLFKDQLVIQETSKIYYQDTTGAVKELWSGAVRHVTVLNDLLIAAYYDRIYFYTDFSYRKQQVVTTCNYIDSRNSSGKYWLANSVDGIVQASLDIDSGDYQVLVSGITVNNPRWNSINYMTYTQGKLLITGGGKGMKRNGNPGILMVYENNSWYNFDPNEIEKQVELAEGKCLDFMRVAVDPSDPNHYFVSSWGEGVYEFQDNVCINRFSEDNSSLRGAQGYGEGYVRSDGIAFDQKGDLYTTSDEVENGISVFSASRQWKSYYYQPFANEYAQSIFVDRYNRKWLNKSKTTGPGIGIMVINDDGSYYYSNRFIDQQGAAVNVSAYYCFAEDKSGYIWVGTDNGPIRFSSAENVRDGICNRIIGTNDQLDEGYRLLEGVAITTIAVDGGNRKWLGTTGSGVYMVDDTGSALHVENFTTTNSLLISDNIVSIAINDKTGEIFIGTDKGLMSYQSDAVEGSSDYSNVYAYPNPVYPDRQAAGVIITGLMSDSSIRITDLAGNLIVQGTSMGGAYRWNCTNIRGETVKPGIYLVFAAQEDGSVGVVTKIMVIR